MTSDDKPIASENEDENKEKPEQEQSADKASNHLIEDLLKERLKKFNPVNKMELPSDDEMKKLLAEREKKRNRSK